MCQTFFSSLCLMLVCILSKVYLQHSLVFNTHILEASWLIMANNSLQAESDCLFLLADCQISFQISSLQVHLFIVYLFNLLSIVYEVRKALEGALCVFFSFFQLNEKYLVSVSRFYALDILFLIVFLSCLFNNSEHLF